MIVSRIFYQLVSVNIHSHLDGAMIFVYFLVTFRLLFPTDAATTWKDTAVHAIFLGSAVFCLSASAIYHSVGAHSQKIAKSFNALDYAGIVGERLSALVFRKAVAQLGFR